MAQPAAKGVWDGAAEIDLRGLKCPLPAMKTSRALARLSVGARLVVRATDPMSVIDVPHAAARLGGRVVETIRAGREIVFRIER